MDTPLFLNVVAYVLLILVIQYIKFKVRDSSFSCVLYIYGWWLIGLCFVAILVILAAPQFQNPFNALDVPAIG
ncbi:membrane protein, partial [Lactiplantibacillus plantarum]